MLTLPHVGGRVCTTHCTHITSMNPLSCPHQTSKKMEILLKRFALGARACRKGSSQHWPRLLPLEPGWAALHLSGIT